MLQSNLLRGERVRFTAVTPADLPVLTKWWADADFLRLYYSVPAYPKTESQLAKRIEAGQKGDNTFLFGIRPSTTEQSMGARHFHGNTDRASEKQNPVFSGHP